MELLFAFIAANVIIGIRSRRGRPLPGPIMLAAAVCLLAVAYTGQRFL